ncbi:MAG TPA: class I SAM-dependent methyltransferase [Acidimicrobiia bacterium]|nr:class I SAM-dependent methyltransferase [Acidimicrobiia bacterium]
MGLTGTRPSSSQFYDWWSDLFLRGFGPVLQAGIVKTGDPPREDPRRSILALAERAGLKDGDRVLDAGCGVAGPAIIIASKYPNVVIDAVTNSVHQCAIARSEVAAARLAQRVRPHSADYEQLPFSSGSFDQVLFFESTGYAIDLAATYGEAYRVLKPGGRLYVKDVFCSSASLSDSEAREMAAFDELWGCVRSKTLVETVEAIADAGLEVVSSGLLQNVGTSRFAGSMFHLDRKQGLRPTELGMAFLRRGLNPPIEFGEVRARKPESAHSSLR